MSSYQVNKVKLKNRRGYLKTNRETFTRQSYSTKLVNTFTTLTCDSRNNSGLYVKKEFNIFNANKRLRKTKHSKIVYCPFLSVEYKATCYLSRLLSASFKINYVYNKGFRATTHYKQVHFFSIWLIKRAVLLYFC